MSGIGGGRQTTTTSTHTSFGASFGALALIAGSALLILSGSLHTIGLAVAAVLACIGLVVVAIGAAAVVSVVRAGRAVEQVILQRGALQQPPQQRALTDYERGQLEVYRRLHAEHERRQL